MPYPSALSGANQTRYRNGTRSTRRYVVAHTPTVIFQFNPSANADGTSASHITYSATLAGAYTSVLQYMTVYVTPTTDYVNDLQTRPEDCLRTYVRKDPIATILYIGLTAFQWTTASYVTVVDNFEVFEKKTIIEGGVIYKDSDIAYRAPLPRITANYHRLTVTSASNANISPTPTETAMASGASISSRTWAVVENGVVTKAVSTSATPTFNLDLGTHWLHLTTTDSNGNKGVSVAFVAVVPDVYNDVVSDLTCETVSNSLSGGTSADIAAQADTGSQLTTLVPGTFGLVFTEVVFTDNTKAQHIEMCGWFDAPVTLELVGDEQFGIRKEYRTKIIGVKEAAASIRIPAFPFQYTASPAVWGQVARCTVYDAVWYTLSDHSTIAHVSSVEFPSGYTDYQFNPALQVPSGAILDSVENQAFRASAGTMNYAPNGELIFAQSGIYATSGRDSLTTYATYDAGENDALRYGITRPPVNRFALSSVQAGFATWNTTTNLPRIYRSVAPANQTPAALFEQIDGVIMTKNLTHPNALIEAGKLASNHFFAGNESLQFDVDFVDGYLTIVPSCFQWHKFNVLATALLDGSSFDSNTRFLCIAISSRYDVERGSFAITGTFRQETDGGDNYARETEFVPSDTTQVEPVYPLGTFSPYLEDFDIQDAADTYGTGFDGANAGIEDPTLPPEITDDNVGNNPGVLETVSVPLTGGVVTTNLVSTLGASYLLRVSGTGRISGGSGSTIEFTTGAQGFTIVNTDIGQPSGQYSAGTGFIAIDSMDSFNNIYRAVTIINSSLSLPSTTSVTAIYDYTQGSPELMSAFAGHIVINGGTPTQRDFTQFVNGTDIGWRVAMGAATVTEIRVVIACDLDLFLVPGSGNAGSVTIKRILINDGEGVLGDAVYYYPSDESFAPTEFPNGSGLYLDGAAISNTEPYNTSHTYELTVTGTGSPFDFSFTDGYDSSYSENSGTLTVQILAL